MTVLKPPTFTFYQLCDVNIGTYLALFGLSFLIHKIGTMIAYLTVICDFKFGQNTQFSAWYIVGPQ